MKNNCLVIICTLLLIISCKSSKETISSAQTEAFEKLVAKKEFTINSNWAYPQITNAMMQVMNSGIMMPDSRAGAINLIGNTNFLTIKGDSVSSYLPYFGERQMQVGYGGTDSAIQFNGLMEDFEIKDGKNERKIITFNAVSNSENFNVIITLFPNLKSQIQLNGSGRFFIQYTGEVDEVEESKPSS